MNFIVAEISKVFRSKNILCDIDESLFSHSVNYNIGRFSSKQFLMFGIADTFSTTAIYNMKIAQTVNLQLLMK